MPKKEKDRKRKYQRERHHDFRHNEFFKKYQRIYDRMKIIEK